jgi:hypothetical protein
LEEKGSDLVWITHFYKDKNFYTWNDPKSPEESLSYDLLCRGIEWLSGTKRIEDYKTLLENVEKFGILAATLKRLNTVCRQKQDFRLVWKELRRKYLVLRILGKLPYSLGMWKD